MPNASDLCDMYDGKERFDTKQKRRQAISLRTFDLAPWSNHPSWIKTGMPHFRCGRRSGFSLVFRYAPGAEPSTYH